MELTRGHEVPAFVDIGAYQRLGIRHPLANMHMECRLLTGDSVRNDRSAARSMLPFVFRNSGVGMNAGVPCPDAEKRKNVNNFVADVSEEVLAERDVETNSAGVSSDLMTAR